VADLTFNGEAKVVEKVDPPMLKPEFIEKP